MKKRILRTACGSAVAPFLINQLRQTGNWVLATDIDKRAVGFYFANKHIIVPRVSDPNYVPSLLQICKDEQIEIFWPDLDEELLLIANHRAEFEALGTQVLLTNLASLLVCSDKFLTADFLRKNQIPAPETTTNVAHLPAYPFIIKPRNGRGSQGVHLIKNETELQALQKFTPQTDVVYQSYLEGIEFTVDALSDFDGKFLYAIPRMRLATDSGISTKGKVFANEKLVSLVKKACNLLRLQGPCCFQGKINFATNEISFFEINPRIAGSANLSVAAGAPIIKDSVSALLKLQIEQPTINYQTVMLRYWSEQIIYEP